jgi:hypothetical protein
MDRARLALLVALAALATSAGCKREVKLEKRDLPGLSILLPVGRDARPPRLEYRDGFVAIASESPLAIALMIWSPGTKLNDEQLQLALHALGPLVHAPVPGKVTTEPGPGGKPVETMRVSSDSVPLLLSQIECAGRNVLIATGAESAGEDLHHRVLMSFECKPDPALEPTLKEVQVELQLDLPGWYAVSRDDNQLELSDGTATLLIQPMASLASDRLLEGIAPVLSEAFHGAVTAELVGGNRVTLHGTVDGEPLVGWAKLMPCPRSKSLAIALAPDQPAADALERAFANATCLPAGAPPQQWPAPPPSPDPSPQQPSPPSQAAPKPGPT